MAQAFREKFCVYFLMKVSTCFPRGMFITRPFNSTALKERGLSGPSCTGLEF